MHLTLKKMQCSKISLCPKLISLFEILKVYKYLVVKLLCSLYIERGISNISMVKLLCSLFSCISLFCIILQAWIFGQEYKYTVTTIELLNHFRIKYVNVSAFFFFFSIITNSISSKTQISLLMFYASVLNFLSRNTVCTITAIFKF
jgi:hypothetical protein